MTFKFNRKDQSILLAELPRKHEYVIHVKLNEFQRKLYRAFLEANNDLDFKTNILYYCAVLQKINNHPDILLSYCKRQGAMASKSKQPLANKKKPRSSAADDEFGDDVDDAFDSDMNEDEIEAPTLISQDFSWASAVLANDYKMSQVNNSNKMLLLLKIVELCYEQKEKLLVFTQFTETLDVIEDMFANTRIGKEQRTLRKDRDYYRLDGQSSLSVREGMIREFQRPESMKKVFLISTRFVWNLLFLLNKLIFMKTELVVLVST